MLAVHNTAPFRIVKAASEYLVRCFGLTNQVQDYLANLIYRLSKIAQARRREQVHYQRKLFVTIIVVV